MGGFQADVSRAGEERRWGAQPGGCEEGESYVSEVSDCFQCSVLGRGFGLLLPRGIVRCDDG